MQRRGRPTKKRKGNISGLKNQGASPVSSCSSNDRSASPASGLYQQQVILDTSDNGQSQSLLDSTRVNWEEEEMGLLNSDLDDGLQLDVWDDENLAEILDEMTRKADEADGDWLPLRLREQQTWRKGEYTALQNLKYQAYGLTMHISTPNGI